MHEFVEESLRRRREEADLLDEEPRPLEIVLAVDQAVSVETVAGVLRDFARFDIGRLFFAFEAHREYELEPPPSRVVEHATREEGRQRVLGEPPPEYMEALDECPEIQEVFDALETTVPENRSAHVRNELPSAWLTCNCQTDLELVVGLRFWRPELASDDLTPLAFVETDLEEATVAVSDAGSRRWAEVATEIVE